MRFSKTLVVAAVGGLMLAGCGGDDGSSADDTTITVSSGKGGGADLFKAMSDAQMEAGTFTFDLTMTAAVSGEEEPIVDATGSAEVVDGMVNQELEMSMGGGSMGTPMDVEMVLLDGITYTNMFSAMGAPAEQEWVSIDPGADDSFSKTFGTYMKEQAALADSTAMFEENADALTVEEGKTDTIDGADVAEYLVTVEKKDFEKLGVGNADMIPIDELTYSVWVDGDYLPRRINFAMGEEAGGVKMELSTADFGKDVTIEAPAEDEVIPVGDFIDDMLESGDITEEDLKGLEEQFANM